MVRNSPKGINLTPKYFQIYLCPWRWLPPPLRRDRNRWVFLLLLDSCILAKIWCLHRSRSRWSAGYARTRKWCFRLLECHRSGWWSFRKDSKRCPPASIRPDSWRKYRKASSSLPLGCWTVATRLGHFRFLEPARSPACMWCTLSRSSNLSWRWCLDELMVTEGRQMAIHLVGIKEDILHSLETVFRAIEEFVLEIRKAVDSSLSFNFMSDRDSVVDACTSSHRY